MPKKRIALFDGDILTYRCAAAGEERSITACHLKSGKEKDFKNTTEFKKYLKEKNYPFSPDDYIIYDVQKPNDPAIVMATIKRQVDKALGDLFADEMEMYLGAGETFRHRLALPKPYKGQRIDMIRPVHLEEARKFVKHKYKAEVVSQVEADDWLSIRAYEELAKGNEPVIVSSDKDTYQSNGVRVYDWTVDNPQEFLVPLIGELNWVKYKSSGGTYKGSGLKFLAYQILAGDTADNYCGYDLSKVKYSAKKAVEALEGVKTPSDIQMVLEREYKLLYPSRFEYRDCHADDREADWEDMLKMYFKAAYMLRSRHDEGNIYEFFEQFRKK